MTAPTEAEIRESILADSYAWAQFSDAFTALGGTLDRLYDSEDLRKSEQEDLDAITSDDLDAVRDRATAEVTEALVRGAIAFAAKHPDAPRAVRVLGTPGPRGTVREDLTEVEPSQAGENVIDLMSTLQSRVEAARQAVRV